MRLTFDTSKTQTQSVIVMNTGETPCTVDVYLRDFLQQSNGEEIELEDQPHPRSALSWLTVSPQGLLTLPPGAKEELRVTMTPPKDEEGIYWAKLYVHEASRPEPVEAKQGEMTMKLFIRKRWEIRIHATAPGASHQGDMVGFRYNTAHEEIPSHFIVTFQNQGEDLLRCQGRVELRNEEGETVLTLPMDEDGSFSIYPGVSRHVAAVMQEPPPPGSYIALAIVDYGGEHLVAGEMPIEIESEPTTATVSGALPAKINRETAKLNAAQKEVER